MKKITNVAVHIVERWMPDAFLFAIILTIVVFIGCMLLTGVGPLRVLGYWGSDSGFWGLLAFSMQMCLVVVLGSALAKAPVVAGILKKLAGLAHTPKQGILVTVLVSAVCMWINWGFGLIAGVLLAKGSGKTGSHHRLPPGGCFCIQRNLHVACRSVRLHPADHYPAWHSGWHGIWHG